MSARTGRPKINNPNAIPLTVRINENLHKRLENYCKEKNISKGEVVRVGIEKVLDKK